MQFREDQLPILEYDGGTMAVSAVPGAGKTFIIAHLASKIIEKELDKGKILIVTYMNSAVNNFKSRISRVLDEKNIKSDRGYEVMTIHSLAMKILQERPDIVGLDQDIRVLDDVKKSVYIGKCIEAWRRNGGEAEFKNLLCDYGIKKYSEKGEKWWKNFSSIIEVLIGELKLHSISPEMVHGHIIQIVNHVYKNYQKLLKLNGYVDYDDIIILAYKALESDGSLREKFQKRYSFIFEDECQDSNLVQYKILSLISNKADKSNLVRVGDLNQSIMGSFTSSDSRYFEDFIENADKNYVMNMAGRSSREIIDLANYLVEYTRKKHPEKSCRDALKDQIIKPVENMKNLKNPVVDEYGIRTYCMSSWDHIKDFTAKAIVSFKKKHPDLTMAVLVPFNKHVEEISEELSMRHIDCDELSSTAGERIKITNTLGRILQFIGEPDNINKFKSLIGEIIEGDRDKVDIIIDYISEFHVEYIISGELFKTDFMDKLNKVDKGISAQFENICSKMKHILENSTMDILNFMLYIGRVFEFNVEDSAMLQSVASYVKYEISQNPNLTIERIAEELLDAGNPVFRHMSEVIYSIRGYEPTPEKVTVSTYHKSKGLEWDCVFLLYLNNYTYPSSIRGRFRSEYYFFKDEFRNPTALGKAEIRKFLGKQDDSNPIVDARREMICEKIRLLYVSITRAKKYLVVMSHYDKSKRDYPSEYFNVIKKFTDEKSKEFNL